MTPMEQLIAALPPQADGALIETPVNRRYLTGFQSSAGVLLVLRQEAYLLVDSRYFEKAEKEAVYCRVLLREKTMDQLEELFVRHQVKCLAVESGSMTLHDFQMYQSRFPEMQWETDRRLQDGLDDLRRRKTEKELDKIRQAQRITDEAFSHIITILKPGMAEKEVALELEYDMRRQGADGISFETIAVSGANSSMPHGVPTEKRLESGDFLTMDFGAVVDGYHSDMTRTVVIGTVSEEMKHVYSTVLKAQETALAHICAGMRGREADALARDIIADAGYGGYFGHSLGHGVGLEIHEFPNLSPREEHILREGEVVTVEPGIYLPGRFGVRIEDMVVITKDGCENLTHSSKELIII